MSFFTKKSKLGEPEKYIHVALHLQIVHKLTPMNGQQLAHTHALRVKGRFDFPSRVVFVIISCIADSHAQEFYAAVAWALHLATCFPSCVVHSYVPTGEKLYVRVIYPCNKAMLTSIFL